MNTLYIFLMVLPLINAQYGDSNHASEGMTTAASSTAASASTTVHKVDIGEDGFSFSPDTLDVSPGETVEFHFHPQNHSVAQASFDNPCHPANVSSFSSGFVPTSQESKTVFTVTINDTTPIWYYCGQVGHCQAGMVGVINAPSSGQETLGAFKQAAVNAKGSTIPATVQGGLLGETKEPSSSTTSESATQTAKSTSSPNHAGSSEGNAIGMAIVLVLSCFVSLSMM